MNGVIFHLVLFLWVDPPIGVSGIPSDWVERVDNQQMFFAENDGPVKSTLRATIGNGYLATQIGSSDVFIAGVFNGYLTKDPSHRARVPSPLNIRVKDAVTYATALDVERGTFFRRSLLHAGTNPDACPMIPDPRRQDCGFAGITKQLCEARHCCFNDTYHTSEPQCYFSEYVHIESRFYAHRSVPSLLVVEVDVTVPPGSDVSVAFDSTPGLPSKDIDFKVIKDSPHVTQGQIRTTEIKNGDKVTVAVAADSVGVISAKARATTSVVFVSALRTSIETSGNVAAAAEDDLAAGRAMFANGTLWNEHINGWSKLWKSGVEVAGRPDVAGAINTSLYYLHSSVRGDRMFSLSPGGLASNGYNGHTFWDCETWMFPSLLLLREDARTILQYRVNRLKEAEDKAKSYDPPFSGAMIPWESAYTGAETCPSWAATGLREQHISGDVSFAMRQHWEVTQDATWLKEVYPLIAGIADFWVSKTKLSRPADPYYHIDDVIPPDEYADHANDSVYTNYVAKLALEFAVDAAKILGEQANEEWGKIAPLITILFNSTTRMHPEFQQYQGQKIKQADVVLLGFPLGMPMNATVRKNDLDFYAQVTDPSGPAMTWAMHAIGYLDIGDESSASSNFNRSFANAQEPYLVWTETPSGGTTNFITGAGGFLQGVLYGYPTLRIRADGLTFAPRLMEGSSQHVLRGLRYLGNVVTISISYTKVSIELVEAHGASLSVICSSGITHPLAVGTPVVVPRAPFTLRKT